MHANDDNGFADQVIAAERGALDRWCEGDPGAYVDMYATDGTYFDPAVDARIDGRAALDAYMAPLSGKIFVDRYEMQNPNVAVDGDVGILTYHFVTFAAREDGSEDVTSRWNATLVYRRTAAAPELLHSHWSFTRAIEKLA